MNGKKYFGYIENFKRLKMNMKRICSGGKNNSSSTLVV